VEEVHACDVQGSAVDRTSNTIETIA
jgi:hypothetical protein